MDKSFTIKMEKIGPMEFKTTFDKDFPPLFFDEPPGSGGEDKYANASRVLTAAVANCLSASFTFCSNKAKVPVQKMETEATCSIERNEEGFWEIKKIDVILNPIFASDVEDKRKKNCLGIFKNYCIVTGSVVKGIDVKVDVNL